MNDCQVPGLCAFCQKPITPGKDTYDVDTKQNWHEACRAKAKPDARSIAIADACGFVEHERALETGWLAICADWSMRKLPAADGSPATGRTESAARSLFDSGE